MRGFDPTNTVDSLPRPNDVTRVCPSLSCYSSSLRCPCPRSRQVDWQDLYHQAITHVQQREWKPAEEKLLTAIGAGPQSGRGVVRRLRDREDYFPEFYLGIVYLNTNRVGAALAQFQLARKNDVNTGSGDFRQLNDLESRARSMLEVEARLAEKEMVDPAAQYRTIMGRAQRAFGEARYDEAETLARLARNLNVDNAAADLLVQNAEARRHGDAARESPCTCFAPAAASCCS